MDNYNLPRAIETEPTQMVMCFRNNDYQTVAYLTKDWSFTRSMVDSNGNVHGPGRSDNFFMMLHTETNSNFRSERLQVKWGEITINNPMISLIKPMNFTDYWLIIWFPCCFTEIPMGSSASRFASQDLARLFPTSCRCTAAQDKGSWMKLDRTLKLFCSNSWAIKNTLVNWLL